MLLWVYTPIHPYFYTNIINVKFKIGITKYYHCYPHNYCILSFIKIFPTQWSMNHCDTSAQLEKSSPPPPGTALVTHASHPYEFSPVCMRRCVVNWPLWLNGLSQISAYRMRTGFRQCVFFDVLSIIDHFGWMICHRYCMGNFSSSFFPRNEDSPLLFVYNLFNIYLFFLKLFGNFILSHLWSIRLYGLHQFFKPVFGVVFFKH